MMGEGSTGNLRLPRDERRQSSEEDRLSREKDRTLLMAWLLSLWAPIASGVAVAIGRSAVQVADLLRRTSELIALIAAWAVNRKVSRASSMGAAEAARLESMSGLLVAAIMVMSFAFILWNAVSRIVDPRPTGTIVPGMLIASGGAIVNGYFWHKSRRLSSSGPSPIFETQWRLYRAKTSMDLSVIVTLSLTRLLGPKPWSGYIDPGGSILVASFLLGSALKIGSISVRGLLGIAKD